MRDRGRATGGLPARCAVRTRRRDHLPHIKRVVRIGRQVFDLSGSGCPETTTSSAKTCRARAPPAVLNGGFYRRARSASRSGR